MYIEKSESLFGNLGSSKFTLKISYSKFRHYLSKSLYENLRVTT